jgi:RecA/RadA recombinase
MIHHWTHNIIRTPIDTINIIGAGGVDQGTITEIAGPPGSGKSAYAYGTASNFLKDNPGGVVVILDPELSVDLIRLEYTFELDMSRVIILNARTLEDGFTEIFRILKDQISSLTADITFESFLSGWKLEDAMKLLKEVKIDFNLSLLDENVQTNPEIIAKARKDICTILAFRGKLRPWTPIPILIIWDTIAASKPKAEVEAAMAGKDPMNAGGMGLRARVLEVNLAIVMASLYERPVTIFLLNQIRTSGFGTYQGPKEGSSGGNALKHANHYYLWFSWSKKLYDDKTKMYIGSKSTVSVLKSKFGPTIEKIPIYINDQLGGKIVSDNEPAFVAVDIGFIYSSGTWWKIKGDPASYRWDKTERGGYITNNPEIRRRCIEALVKHFRKNYFTLDIVYKKLGVTLGELTEQESETRNTLFNKSAFKPILKEEEEKTTNE